MSAMGHGAGYDLRHKELAHRRKEIVKSYLGPSELPSVHTSGCCLEQRPLASTPCR